MFCESKQVTKPVRIQVGGEKDSSSRWEKWPSHQAVGCVSREGRNLAISGNLSYLASNPSSSPYELCGVGPGVCLATPVFSVQWADASD